jgi:hypothetical protein
MAGQARRGTQGQGRASHDAPSSPVLAAVSAVGSGSATVTTTAVSSPEPITPFPTRATYRALILRGLAPDEAANLTAYLAGIAVRESHWTVAQINKLLFLREMDRSGYFRDQGDGLH